MIEFKTKIYLPLLFYYLIEQTVSQEIINLIMNSYKKYLTLFLFIISIPVFSQKNIELSSPDGNILYRFKLTKQAPIYEVLYKGKTLIEKSELGFIFKDNQSLRPNLKQGKVVYTEVDETYNLVVGKTNRVRDIHKQALIPLIKNMDGVDWRINLVIRVFNDGVAFRYEFPSQKDWSSYTLLDELSTFNISGNPTVRTLFWDNYTSSHEGIYNKLPYEKIVNDTLMDLPTLFEFDQDLFMLITEANLRDYAGMYLKKANGHLVSQLSPLPGQDLIKVKANLPHRTPWRVMMISSKIGDLLESNILTSLNDPTAIKDVSWIKPGKTTFHWWNGDILPDTTIVPGVNFATNKYYIDFAARNNIEYHSVIGYGGFPWYKSDSRGYSSFGPNTDVTQTVPSLDMQEICDYAKKQGVSIHVWVHWEAIYSNLEKNFKQFEKWGIKGMMVDFMNRDDQEMVQIQEEILKKAAEHKLFIQFHGAYKPTGLSRTYPNEFTREGAYNYENNKWSQRPVSPEHDLNVVFIRMVAGATDYHLGGFRAVTESKYKPQYTRPLMIGTRCHMLAMYVVLESYLSSLCDYPQAYEGEPGFEFLQEIPTTWDETVVPTAKLDEHITIARRKGNSWYVGSINNSEPRDIEVALDFLSNGNYIAEIYSDSPDVDKNPNLLIKEVRHVHKKDILSFKMGKGGGHVVRLVKSEN